MVLNHVQHAIWETCFSEDSAYDAERAGSDFGGFENDCVSSGEGVSYGAETEDVSCVPRRGQ